MIPALIRALEGLDFGSTVVRASQVPANALKRVVAVPGHPVVVYIDPPYNGVTSYGRDQMNRVEVCLAARAWAKVGAHVIVSEREPVEELVGDAHGWHAQLLKKATQDTSPFRGKHEEWVTCSALIPTF